MMKYSFTCLLLLGVAPFLSAQIRDSAFVTEIARHRMAYKEDFLKEPRSPLGANDTAFLDFFPPDITYRIPARFERTPEAEPFELPTYSGQKRDYVQFGILKFELNGQRQTLNIYQNLRLVKDSMYHDHLFLPFKDQSNGGETYGGGRYLDFKQGDIEGNILVLDFNKCYNPWCAYSDGFNCPVPPASNRLGIVIAAGEKNYKGEKKH